MQFIVKYNLWFFKFVWFLKVNRFILIRPRIYHYKQCTNDKEKYGKMISFLIIFVSCCIFSSRHGYEKIQYLQKFANLSVGMNINNTTIPNSRRIIHQPRYVHKPTALQPVLRLIFLPNFIVFYSFSLKVLDLCQFYRVYVVHNTRWEHFSGNLKRINPLTLIRLTWRIWWAPTNASK